MAGWIAFCRERFPIGSHVTLITGFVLSGALISAESRSALGVGLAALGLFLFFAELRLMDELKDYPKDLVAHPERPLPRGALQIGQVRRMLTFLFFGMLALAGTVGVLHSPTAGYLYFAVTLYLGLMYREFFAGEWLSRRPILYAITHQIILIPLCLFTVAVHPSNTTTPLQILLEPHSLGYAFAVLGAFFSYEVCRKLDPQAHPILKTYLSIYGTAKTTVLVLVLLGVAAYGTHLLDSQSLLYPVELIFGLSMISFAYFPEHFKKVEAVATLSLAIHLWAIPLQHLAGKFI